jgi:hypothetical protein
MTQHKIPGMSYTVDLAQSQGRHSLRILLRDAPVSTANLQSYSKEGIKIAMENALKEAEIHIPPYTIDDLTDKLFENSGYLENESRPKEAFEEVILEKLTAIEQRLSAIEKKLGQ